MDIKEQQSYDIGAIISNIKELFDFMKQQKTNESITLELERALTKHTISLTKRVRELEKQISEIKSREIKNEGLQP